MKWSPPIPNFIRRDESLSIRPWTEAGDPDRILIMRLHAVGDVAITFPACVSLGRNYPNAVIDCLTMETCVSLVTALDIFDHVYSFPLCQSRLERIKQAFAFSYQLRTCRYDVVLDLQRNWVSRLIRRLLHPTTWSEFERFTHLKASEAVLDAFRRAGFSDMKQECNMPVNSALLDGAQSLLVEQGWNGIDPLIVLNPAGLWPTRNWPLENYVHFARRWLAEDRAQFLVIGDQRTKMKAEFLQDELGEALIDLVGVTSLAQAFAVLQFVTAMVSEDSGLMHMAWVSGVPTIALFGSTDGRRSGPMGEHDMLLDSSDLDCGPCMSPECIFGDFRCLVRYTPDYVNQKMKQMIVKDRESRKPRTLTVGA